MRGSEGVFLSCEGVPYALIPGRHCQFHHEIQIKKEGQIRGDVFAEEVGTCNQGWLCVGHSMERSKASAVTASRSTPQKAKEEAREKAQRSTAERQTKRNDLEGQHAPVHRKDSVWCSH